MRAAPGSNLKRGKPASTGEIVRAERMESAALGCCPFLLTPAGSVHVSIYLVSQKYDITFVTRRCEIDHNHVQQIAVSKISIRGRHT